MPYAANGKISHDPIEGGVEITEDQYQQALRGVLDGLVVTVLGGFKVAPPTPETALETPSSVPSAVTMRQARLALLNAGLLSSVDTALAAILDEQQRKSAQIEWEYAQTVNRDSALVAYMATALSLTDQRLDDLFITAATL